MLLIRKNEISSNTLSAIAKHTEIYKHDFDMLFSGGNWTESRLNDFFNSVKSNSEEYDILKSLFNSSKHEVDLNTRSFLYMMASLKKYALFNPPEKFSLIYLYLLSNICNIKDIDSFVNEFWNIGIASEIPKTDFSLSINFILDRVAKKSKLISTNDKGIKYLSYHNKNINYKSLRERYFLLKHSDMLKKIFNDKIMNHKELSMPDDCSKFYHLNEVTSIKIVKEKIGYIPSDIMCLFFDFLIEHKVCYPVLGNMIFLKNSKYIVHDMLNRININFVNDMKKIHYEIYSNSSIMHKCDSKEINIIFRRVSNGKI